MGDLSLEVQFNGLLAHYKDTHNIVLDEKKVRERSLLIAVMASCMHGFAIFNAATITSITNSLVNAKFGIKLLLNFNIVNSFFWVILLIAILRYFQANIYINRLYTYLHKIEHDLQILCNKSLIDREGLHHVTNYPMFLAWVYMIYTWLAPFLLAMLSTIKIYSEFNSSISHFALYFDAAIYICLFISVGLYFVYLGHNKYFPIKNLMFAKIAVDIPK